MMSHTQGIVEIIGPTGAGKTAHLKALSNEAPFFIEARHRVRQHLFMLVRSTMAWVFLQLRFCFLDARLSLFKRICVYYAALKTVEEGDKKACEKGKSHEKVQHEVHLVDEGVFHVLLMHRFASLKEQAAWAFFSRQQICRLAKNESIVIFVLSVSRERRHERLRVRNEIESERLRVANHHKGGAFGPLGVEFIRSLECEAAGRVKVVVLDNNGEDSVAANVAMIQAMLMTQEEVLGPVGAPAAVEGAWKRKHGAL
ncbi:hypothetical protein [Halomonas cerina]|uniref:Uncharacterized protein n=1 Tax=Halomonas cerina TaxID=447424 RepID=A0A839V7X0_9GAMM|nr:hypothetical protein [Halomonas cerina]MBB3188794.1 hypothetical protein [Halomonas cerina]